MGDGKNILVQFILKAPNLDHYKQSLQAESHFGFGANVAVLEGSHFGIKIHKGMVWATYEPNVVLLEECEPKYP